MLTIHHEGHAAQGRVRGAHSLQATAETVMAVYQNVDLITVKNPKQRDLAEFDPIRLSASYWTWAMGRRLAS